MSAMITFKGETLTVARERYHNGNTRLQVYDTNGFPHMTATTCAEFRMASSFVMVKDYSENAGIASALEAQGECCHLYAESGEVCRIY